MLLQQLLVKRAQEIREKKAFQPMPGGQPPMDPNAQGGGMPPGGDPSMGGGGMPPGGDPSMGGMPPGMDPSMMGGGMPGMDPSMMGMPPGMAMGAPPPATIGQLSITDFQTIMMDMLSQVLGPLMEGGAGGAGMPPPEVAPQDDKRTVSNTELSEKVDAILAMLSGASAAGPEAGGAPAGGGGFETPTPEMGFGGQAMQGGPAGEPPPMGGMEAQASARPVKTSLADLILKKTAKARKA